jgi:DNA primase large subunit
MNLDLSLQELEMLNEAMEYQLEAYMSLKYPALNSIDECQKILIKIKAAIKDYMNE